jgi:hypothetical protein
MDSLVGPIETGAVAEGCYCGPYGSGVLATHCSRLAPLLAIVDRRGAGADEKESHWRCLLIR